MSDRSTPSQDTPSPAPDTGRGGTIRRGPFPMFLMEIAQSGFGFRSGAWHFADCKGYITAQEGRREPEDSLQGDLIRA